MPWSWELTYQAGGMFLPHTLKKPRPNQYFFAANEKKYICTPDIFLFGAKMLKKKKCRVYCIQHVNVAFRDCTKIIRQGRGGLHHYVSGENFSLIRDDYFI